MTELRTIPRAPARAAERIRKLVPPRNAALALASATMVIATLAAAAATGVTDGWEPGATDGREAYATSGATAQHNQHASPYAGQEKSEIPSLTAEEVAGLLNAEGMGLARAAELNHYPGPKHVLDLTDGLGLGEEQLQQVEAIRVRMQERALALGERIIEAERVLNRRFAHGHIDEAALERMTAEIGALRGELRFVHLRAHLETKAVLSAEQVGAYDELRGYAAASGPATSITPSPPAAATASSTPAAPTAPSTATTPSVPFAPAPASARELFFDDFEEGLGAWEVSNPEVMTIIDSGDAEHGHVFRLAPAEAQIASLIRGSEDWPAYRIEGEVLFPTDEHNYLGWIYNYRENERRADLGSLYIKGNGTYIRVNPRRDWNPARMLYEEYFTRLTGDDAIVIGEWQRFAAEVDGRICHFYVGDMSVPKVTFEYYEGDSGKAGFKPRVVGGPVWIDNIRAEAIDGLSYTGPRRPEGIEYHRDDLVTDWRVLGPLTRAYLDLEKLPAAGAVAGTAAARDSEGVVDDGVEHRWQPFPADPRGAVVTGRVVEFLGSRSVAYFATTITVPRGEDLELQFSTLDDLALWRNGIFRGYVNGEIFAWHDFGRNPEHPPSDWMRLEPGVNHVLVRVRGGIYATGGFFARVAPAGSARQMLSAR